MCRHCLAPASSGISSEDAVLSDHDDIRGIEIRHKGDRPRKPHTDGSRWDESDTDSSLDDSSDEESDTHLLPPTELPPNDPLSNVSASPTSALALGVSTASSALSMSPTIDVGASILDTIPSAASASISNFDDQPFSASAYTASPSAVSTSPPSSVTTFTESSTSNPVPAETLGLATGVIAGIAVGATLLVLVILGLLFYFCFRRGDVNGRTEVVISTRARKHRSLQVQPGGSEEGEGSVESLPFPSFGRNRNRTLPSIITRIPRRRPSVMSLPDRLFASSPASADTRVDSPTIGLGSMPGSATSGRHPHVEFFRELRRNAEIDGSIREPPRARMDGPRRERGMGHRVSKSVPTISLHGNAVNAAVRAPVGSVRRDRRFRSSLSTVLGSDLSSSRESLKEESLVDGAKPQLVWSSSNEYLIANTLDTLDVMAPSTDVSEDAFMAALLEGLGPDDFAEPLSPIKPPPASLITKKLPPLSRSIGPMSRVGVPTAAGARVRSEGSSGLGAAKAWAGGSSGRKRTSIGKLEDVEGPGLVGPSPRYPRGKENIPPLKNGSVGPGPSISTASTRHAPPPHSATSSTSRKPATETTSLSSPSNNRIVPLKDGHDKDSTTYRPVTTPKKISPVKLSQLITNRKTTPSKPTPNAEVSVVEDYSALLEGCSDWDFDIDDELLSSPQAPTVPLSRQYLRCKVLNNSEAQWVQERKRLERRFTVGIIPDPLENPEPGRTFPTTTQSQGETLEQREVLLLDDWATTPVNLNSVINILSLPLAPPLPRSPGLITLSRSEPGHLLVLHPGTLISATSVSNAPACSRKSVLGDRLRGARGDVGEAVVVGNVVHEVIQNMLIKGPDSASKKEIDDIGGDLGDCENQGGWKARDLLKETRKACGNHVDDLFMLGKNVEEGVAMVKQKLEELPKWSARYLALDANGCDEIKVGADAVLSDPRSRNSDPSCLSRVAITGVYDIEEEIWSPKYGLKGKIDASVRALVVPPPGSGTDSKSQGLGDVMPFEIKTGRSMAGLEHRAQTMLYTLMMSDRYDVNIPAGLLFYSHTNEIIHVEAAPRELRQLIMARNEMADYVHHPEAPKKWKTETEEEESQALLKAEEDKAATVVEEKVILPEPVDDERMCKRCYSSDACMLYRKTVEGIDAIPHRKGLEPLQEMYEAKTGHLTPTHSAFFKHWEGLISLEEQESGRFKREIWEMTAHHRQRAGRAFADMQVDTSFRPEEWASTSKGKIHRFTYRLHPAVLPAATAAGGGAMGARSLLSGHIGVNDPITVSIEGEKLAIAKGFILELTPYHLVIGIDHQLDGSTDRVLLPQPSAHPGEEQFFRIDKDELQAGMGKIRDNLAQLFYVGGDSKRRELVVDLRAPVFDSEELVMLDGYKHLNEDQLGAIETVLTAKDYALILGMPGTGKTTTIAAVIDALVRDGKSILLTSYTHSAVDTILTKLIGSDIKLLRLGNKDKVAPALQAYTLDETNSSTTVEELEERLLSPQVVATTSLSINHPLFAKRHFDYCIVDEASQITLPTCLGPLRFADVFVLVGDHHQLPPLVKNTAAREGGLDVSLFKRLSDAHPQAVAYLTQQYRMNEDIMSLSNALVYDGRLKCGNEDVAKRGLELPVKLDVEPSHTGGERCSAGCWVEDLLDPARKVVFIDTDSLPAPESRVGNLIQNEVEAGLIYQTVQAFLRSGASPSEVAVITPYRQQIKLLNYLFESIPAVEIMTADKSQGRDKDCIIMSLVRSNEGGHVGELLRDWRRINVCITRARAKLVLFGSRKTLAESPLLGKFLEMVQAKGWLYSLPAGAYGAHAPLASPKLLAAASPVEKGKKRLGGGMEKNEGKKVKATLGVGQEVVLKSRPFLRDCLTNV